MNDYLNDLKECLEGKGLYDPTLDPAIKTLASIMERYDDVHDAVGKEILITQISREGDVRHMLNPAATLEVQLAEQIRKYMRDLGLVVAKPAGFVSQEKDTRPRNGDKLVTLLSSIEQPKAKLYKK